MWIAPAPDGRIDMQSQSRNRPFERMVLASLAVLVTTLLGVLLHAGFHPQLLA